jgi:hypothetical protein
MEFAIATIISVIALGIAYFTYRAQVAPAMKRLHYSGLAFDLIMPVVHDDLRPLFKLYLKGQALINPVVCVARIQNTGKAPIRREDFDGPLVIQSVEAKAIFRGNTIDCDPPNIFDFNDPDNVPFEVKANKFMVRPVLLNPADKFQVMYIADMVPDEWEVSVSCRIAGLEKVSRIPIVRSGMGHDMYIERIGSQFGDAPPTPPEGLTLNIWVSPVLACIGGRLNDELKLKVQNRVIDDPHIFYAIVHNSRDVVAGRQGSSSISVNLPGARIIRTIARRSDGSEAEHEAAENVGVTGEHVLKINVPTLQAGDLLRIYAITSGFCASPLVQYHDFQVDDALLFQFKTEDLIEKNLPEIDPVILLSNQKLHLAWRKMTEHRRWLNSHSNE